ncbi:MAG: hypothetical protein ACK5NA_08530 [Enterococcus sp.]
MEKFIDEKISTAKKEIDRLENRRTEDLGNSINYVENELQIQRLMAQVEVLEEVLAELKK